jgi:hypothetical protein
MQLLGTGPHLWRVEVVLWTTNRAPRRETDLIDAVLHKTMSSDDDDPAWPSDVATARSYDIQPPAPDASVGIACWVRAASVGGAADTAWAVVASAADRLLDEPYQLWDLRVIPRSAILSGTTNATPLTR